MSETNVPFKSVMISGPNIIVRCADAEAVKLLMKSEIDVFFGSEIEPKATGQARLFHPRVTKLNGVVLDLLPVSKGDMPWPRSIKIQTPASTHFIGITDMFNKARAHVPGEFKKYTQPMAA